MNKIAAEKKALNEKKFGKADTNYLDPATNKFEYEALKGKFPEGVDPTAKEQYLSPEKFEALFGMSMDKFNELKDWKKKQLKQQHDLF